MTCNNFYDINHQNYQDGVVTVLTELNTCRMQRERERDAYYIYIYLARNNNTFFIIQYVVLVFFSVRLHNKLKMVYAQFEKQKKNFWKFYGKM